MEKILVERKGDSHVSGSMKEGEIVRTLALTFMMNSCEIDNLEKQFRKENLT
jgi:hypothetical protein